MTAQTPQDVIADHRYVVPGRCSCGHQTPHDGTTLLSWLRDQHAAHQLDALAAEGWAVVKLPDPVHHCDRDVAWMSRDDEIQVDYDRRGGICVSYPDGSDIPIYGPWDEDRALDVGAALLAAHAEAVRDD